jgi:hypothetical protein
MFSRLFSNSLGKTHVVLTERLLNEEQGRLILGENAAKLLYLEFAAEVSQISHA